MSALVPRQSLGSLASAIAGQLRGHMDGIGQSCTTDHKLRGNDQIAPLSGEECEPPASPADVLDTAKASHKRVRNPEGFQHFPLFDHANALRLRPRAGRASGASFVKTASGTKSHHTKVEPHGLRAVNGAAS